MRKIVKESCQDLEVREHCSRGTPSHAPSSIQKSRYRAWSAMVTSPRSSISPDYKGSVKILEGLL